MRFIQQLTPLLSAASSTGSLSRVVSVMDPQAGLRARPNLSDLALQKTFSLKNCYVHASAMQNLALYRLAREHTSTTYIHAYPSGVETSVLRQLVGRFEPAVKFAFAWARRWIYVPQGESGERHLFAATAPVYPAKGDSGEGADVMVGSDGVKGSGSYLVNWNGDILADRKTAKEMREEGVEEKIWKHTEEVFKTVCDEGKKY